MTVDDHLDPPETTPDAAAIGGGSLADELIDEVVEKDVAADLLAAGITADAALVLAPPAPVPPQEWIRRTNRFFAGAGIFILVGAVSAAAFRGPAADLMEAALQTVPFAILAALAYIGTRQAWGTVLAYVWYAILLTGITSFVVLTSFAAATLGSKGPPPAGGLPLGAIQAAAALVVCLVGLGIAAALLTPAARLAVSRILPIDPQSHVHALALSLTASTSVIFIGQLAAFGGRPVLLEMMKAMPDMLKGMTPQKMLLGMVFNLFWSIPGAIVATGFPVARTLREALHRLGMQRPTAAQVVGGLVLAGAMAGGMYLLDPVLTGVWKQFNWPVTDSATFEKLLAPAFTPLGAVILAVSAGVGEEMAIRGVLQPRLGILLPNIFFTSLHAMQYGFDGLLSVFLVGMILGVVRKRTNTSTSAIVHGTYDFILVVATILSKSS